jgi:hypothetical protein
LTGATLTITKERFPQTIRRDTETDQIRGRIREDRLPADWLALEEKD